MEEHFSTGQSPHWAVVPMEDEEVPLKARRGPEGSRNLRYPDFTIAAQDDGKVVSPMHRPPLLPGNSPGTHFC